jgi:hypothetical protein
MPGGLPFFQDWLFLPLFFLSIFWGKDYGMPLIRGFVAEDNNGQWPMFNNQCSIANCYLIIEKGLS